MKNGLFKNLTLGAIGLFAFSSMAQTVNLNVDASKSVTIIQPTMYGIFFEDINFAADGGLYAEMIKNRYFEFEDPKMGWMEPHSEKYFMNKESGFASVVKYVGDGTNHNYVRVKVNDDSGYQLINEGFRGMGIKKDAKYNLSLLAAKKEGDIQKIRIQFIDAAGNALGETSITPNSSDWKKYEAQLIAKKTEAKTQLKITFEGTGTIELDMISLFPEER